MDLQKNKEDIFYQVANQAKKSGRASNAVSVIAVTKSVDCNIAEALVNTGVKHIAENRVDKFLEKYEALSQYDITWHLIGSLQRRKVKEVINLVDYFHALDSVNLAEEIQKRADHKIKCFLQVNISEEESKHGFTITEIDQALNSIEGLDKIEIVGLMTMAPLDADPEMIANIFKKTNQLRQDLKKQNRKNMPFTELSMGMSNDYPIAIQEGATFVRIGTSFFK